MRRIALALALGLMAGCAPQAERPAAVTTTVEPKADAKADSGSKMSAQDIQAITAYHDKVLARIRDRFYRIPAWLPQRGCEFCERYFPL